MTEREEELQREVDRLRRIIERITTTATAAATAAQNVIGSDATAKQQSRYSGQIDLANDILQIAERQTIARPPRRRFRRLGRLLL